MTARAGRPETATVLSLGILLMLQPAARAQDPVAQVSQSISRSAAATAPAQVAAPSARDRAAISQLPAGLVERGGVDAAPLEAKSAPAGGLGVALSGAVRQAGSVDADEIARLLARGDAATIDAAAALALGATAGSQPSMEDDLEARQSRARATTPHALVIGDK